MYKPHDVWEIPALESPLWRYMDLTKLLAIVSGKALYFPNLTKFDDKYEGFTPVPTPEELKQHVLPNYKPPGPDTDYDQTAEDLHKRLKAVRNAWPRYLYVNCWHMNDQESAAMWKLYLSEKEGVAIRTTFRRLRDAFDNTPQEILFGKVKYLKIDSMDFEQRNQVHTPLLKRPSFAHEQELRAIYKDQDRAERDRNKAEPEEIPSGYNIPIDTDILIESIFLAPTCEPWIRPVVVSVLERYGLRKAVVQSNLNDGPVW